MSPHEAAMRNPHGVTVLYRGVPVGWHSYSYDIGGPIGWAILCVAGEHYQVEELLEIYYGPHLLYHSPDLWYHGIMRPY
jgi:hypothetical protein